MNLAMELAECGFLAEQGVRLLGTNVDSIRKAEDREAFKETMEEIGEPLHSKRNCQRRWTRRWPLRKRWAIPLLCGPAYTLGGTGGGIAGQRWPVGGDRAPHGLHLSPRAPDASSKRALRAGKRSNTR